VLRDIEGLSTAQTAQALNVGHTAAKARLWRARLQLPERLNKSFSKQTTSECPVSSFRQADGSDSRSSYWAPGSVDIPGMLD
jgi:hypothetical protein